MGQVVAFPVQLPRYPGSAAELGTADCILLIAIRWWVEAYRAGEDPIPRLCQGLETADVHDAAFAIDRLMAVLARCARRQIDVHCPRCPDLSNDEKQLLHAASLAQACSGWLAEKALRATLLSAEDAAFAAVSLDDLAELFATARLFLARCASPVPDAEMEDEREPWLPPPAIH
jgi:hypothetical protein